MSLYDEAIKDAAEQIEADAAEMAAETAAPESAPGVRFSMPDFSFLAAPTGEGAIEEYIEHPLNFDKRNSTARIIRGCTGICGQLNYALIDITLGIIEKWKEKGTPNVDRP